MIQASNHFSCYDVISLPGTIHKSSTVEIKNVAHQKMDCSSSRRKMPQNVLKKKKKMPQNIRKG